MRRGSKRRLENMRRKLESMRIEDFRRNVQSCRRSEIRKKKWLHYAPLLTTDPPQLHKGPLRVAHTRKMATKCSQTG